MARLQKTRARSRSARSSKPGSTTTRRKQRNPVSAEQRRHMIAEAANYRVEQRGFVGGDVVADWLAAEAEIDERLRKTS